MNRGSCALELVPDQGAGVAGEELPQEDDQARAQRERERERERQIAARYAKSWDEICAVNARPLDLAGGRPAEPPGYDPVTSDRIRRELRQVDLEVPGRRWLSHDIGHGRSMVLRAGSGEMICCAVRADSESASLVASGIARLRNTAADAADQLLAADAEIALLASSIPICRRCERRPATCFGAHGTGAGSVLGVACDQCCGHGSDDGWCVPLEDLPDWACAAHARAEALRVELEALRAEIEDLRRAPPSQATGQPCEALARPVVAASRG